MCELTNITWWFFQPKFTKILIRLSFINSETKWLFTDNSLTARSINERFIVRCETLIKLIFSKLRLAIFVSNSVLSLIHFYHTSKDWVYDSLFSKLKTKYSIQNCGKFCEMTSAQEKRSVIFPRRMNSLVNGW